MTRRGRSGAAVPRWVWAPAALGATFVLLPLVAVAARTPWSRLGELLSSPAAQDALWLSLRTSAASTLLCLMLGVPMALVLARTQARGLGLLRSLVLLPLVLPPVVGGIALLYTFGRRGLLGHTLEVLGVQIAFSTAAVVVAQTFVAMPFLVVSLEGALRTAGERYDLVAASLSARPTVFRRVTLPLVAPDWCPAPCLRSRAPWVSSGPRSPSRAACRVALGPSPSPRSTCVARPTSRAQWPCPCCWCWWRSW
ncbi:MAG: molybdate ABC transporter permease subunit [Nocardioides sp.]